MIDHLLATPDVQGPIELVQPNVMYLYADPKLEALSAGQKTLIRMGPENAGAIKMKLRELRNLLATHTAPGQAAQGAPAETGGPPGAAPSPAAPGQGAAPAPGPRVVPAPQPSATPAPAPPPK